MAMDASRIASSPLPLMIVFDQSRNASRSSMGTASSSQITVMGSGKANASSSSTSSLPAIWSSSSAVISSILGRSCSIRRAVNALVTSLRSRVWSGGSLLSMCALSTSANSPRSAGLVTCLSNTAWNARPSLLTLGSASAALASS